MNLSTTSLLRSTSRDSSVDLTSISDLNATNWLTKLRRQFDVISVCCLDFWNRLFCGDSSRESPLVENPYCQTCKSRKTESEVLVRLPETNFLYSHYVRFISTNTKLMGDYYIAEEHHLHIYLEDAISQLLALRQENSKIKHVKFFREYFRSVQQGSHVLFRDYEFISATPHNRASVLECFWRTYKTMHYNGEQLSIQDCHSLLHLLWPDFPENLVQLTFKVISPNDSIPQHLPFKEFLYGFQLQYCFEEFLQLALYHFLEARSKNKHAQVNTKEFITVLKEERRKDKMKRFKSFYPSVFILDKVVNYPLLTSFKEFQRILLADEDITRLIGKLPLPSVSEKPESKIPIGTISRPRPLSCLGRTNHLSSSLHSLPVKLTDSETKTGSAIRSKSATHINRRFASNRHHSQ